MIDWPGLNYGICIRWKFHMKTFEMQFCKLTGFAYLDCCGKLDIYQEAPVVIHKDIFERTEWDKYLRVWPGLNLHTITSEDSNYGFVNYSSNFILIFKFITYYASPRSSSFLYSLSFYNFYNHSTSYCGFFGEFFKFENRIMTYALSSKLIIKDSKLVLS